ncbi:MAG: hypothetical protein MJ072_00415 [Clostridia bacterium]|nr:hypothetical protein [Clostridia bacterium]
MKKLGELILNVGGILVFNVVIQLFVYPYISGDMIAKMGEEVGKASWGTALSVISFVGITALPLGSAANYSRTVNESKISPSNGDYNLLMLVGSLVCCVAGGIFLYFIGLFDFNNLFSLCLLMIFTVYRYYADVEYKLSGVFLHYFLFYLVASVGYALGVLVFKWTGNWILGITFGEFTAVAYAFFTTGLFKKDFKLSKSFRLVLKSMAWLLFSEIMENLSLHVDIVLQLTMTGYEVSVFYNASLLGKVVAILTTPISSLIISYLVRFDVKFSGKFWTEFVLLGIVGGGIVFGACLLGSHIFIPWKYPEYYADTLPYLVPAIISQVFYFVSRVLIIILLKYEGEKKQFFFNLSYTVVFVASAFVGIYAGGLNGFVIATMTANGLRFVASVVWGYVYSLKCAKNVERI